MSSGDFLWGKERVVHLLMREQRESGAVSPFHMTFAPSRLGEIAAADDLPTSVIAKRSTRFPLAAARRIPALVRENDIHVIHSHGYKANIVVRALRLLGQLPGIRLVSTCHGWTSDTSALRFYHALDRSTAFISDVTTVPDASMLRCFPRGAKTAHVANGVPDVEPAVTGDDPDVRNGAPYVAGTLGRVCADKGIPEWLEAAAACPDRELMFAVAGFGDLADRVTSASGNVRYVGHVAKPQAYLEQLDVYVQASRAEGLSLALLEAMRAGKAIVATSVGATRDAVIDGETGVLVAPNRPTELLAAVLALKRDPRNAARLGGNARRRFESEFRLGQQHRRFLELYG
jgi:glycosyltransferase involved in cell wall biosynthesis